VGPSEAYYLKLLYEMRDAAIASYDLEMKRLGWAITKSQILFAVLGFAIALLVPRLDAMCDGPLNGKLLWLHWIAFALLMVGGVLWLWAFGLVTSAMTTMKEPLRVGPPDPLKMHDELYAADNEKLLVSSVALSYNASADRNARISDQKTRKLTRAFVFVFVGLLAVFCGTMLYAVERIMARPPHVAENVARAVQAGSRSGEKTILANPRHGSTKMTEGNKDKDTTATPTSQDKKPVAPKPPGMVLPLKVFSENAENAGNAQKREKTSEE
jgi:hypothetical protein